MKHQFTFRQVMMTAVCGLLFVSLLIVLLFGQLFMDRVFITQKQTELIEAFTDINRRGLTDESLLEALEVKNLLITALNTETYEILYSTRPIPPPDRSRVVRETLDNVSNALAAAWEENYYVYTREDYRDYSTATNVVVNHWISISGMLDDGIAITIETPTQPITEVAQLSVTFYLLVSLGAMCLGLLLMLWLAPRLSNPIHDMSMAAKRIAGQDFSTKCETKVAVEEFSELAESLNLMSDEMRHYVTDLKEANSSLTRDIAERERLEQARKTLFSNISHDLKTPIAIISGYAEGLKGGMAHTENEIQEYCDVISDEADRMQNLIVRLLELNRLESGSIPLEYEDFDISDTLDYLLGTFSLYMEKREISLEKSYKPAIYVNSDYTSVEQTLTNIIQNAISHNIEGGQISVTAVVAGNKVRLSIYNTCEPIGSDELPKLWDSFYRRDKSRTRSGGESGLGLAIVKGNMELLQMPYGVRLAPGGIVFWLELPYVAESNLFTSN